MDELCSSCHINQAVVRLTQVQEDTVTTLKLCEKCAALKGVETGGGKLSPPLGGFLAALGAGVSGSGEALGDTCPSCGSTLLDFKETGRLGCASCWTAFEESLVPLLKRLHGSARYVGAMYQPPGEAPPTKAELRALLQRQLDLAIQTESFELAANIRDQIKNLERADG